MSVIETYNLTEFNSFFEIPIYRLSNSAFIKELKSEVLKSAHYHSAESLEELFPGKGKIRYERFLSEIELEKGYQWKFNEIIGWITLHFTDNYIFGEIFLKNSKRITKNSKAKIDFHDAGFKFKIPENESNRTIYENVFKEVKLLEQKTKLKRRHIDISKFETIGPFIDWKNLRKFLND
jgi:hypothetical protein